jgi:hypothetical protein
MRKYEATLIRSDSLSGQFQAGCQALPAVLINLLYVRPSWTTVDDVLGISRKVQVLSSRVKRVAGRDYLRVSRCINYSCSHQNSPELEIAHFCDVRYISHAFESDPVQVNGGQWLHWYPKSACLKSQPVLPKLASNNRGIPEGIPDDNMVHS